MVVSSVEELSSASTPSWDCCRTAAMRGLSKEEAEEEVLSKVPVLLLLLVLVVLSMLKRCAGDTRCHIVWRGCSPEEYREGKRETMYAKHVSTTAATARKCVCA